MEQTIVIIFKIEYEILGLSQFSHYFLFAYSDYIHTIKIKVLTGMHSSEEARKIIFLPFVSFQGLPPFFGSIPNSLPSYFTLQAEWDHIKEGNSYSLVERNSLLAR